MFRIEFPLMIESENTKQKRLQEDKIYLIQQDCPRPRQHQGFLLMSEQNTSYKELFLYIQKKLRALLEDRNYINTPTLVKLLVW